MSILEYDEEKFKRCIREDGYLDGLEEGMEKGIAKGIEQGKEEGKVEGRAETILLMCREFGLSKTEAAKRLQTMGGIPEEQVQKYFDEFWMD